MLSDNSLAAGKLSILASNLCKREIETLSLSTVVLNSRDCQGKLWLPKNVP